MFSWARLEPAPGEYDFAWLAEVLDLLYDAGVGVALGTPTASPPPWFTVAHPDVLPVSRRRAVLAGQPAALLRAPPEYRAHALRIVSELARRLGDHPAIRIWHVHNEFACHVPQCFCDVSAAAFRTWLRERYGTVEAMNEAWGASFWSQRYRDFDEVLPPRVVPALPNPGHHLDYRRFSSDSYLAHYLAERDLLRSVAGHIPVTTNYMGFFKPLDYFAWAREQDLCSTDNYPDPADPDSPMLTAMHYDLIRSLKKDVPWTVMEQTTFRVNWRPVNSAKVPGEMRRGSYQALARGAAGILFFQWRASAAGTEKFHSAMLGHAGTATPAWREVIELGEELQRLGELTTARVAADCAILFSWPNWWAVEQIGQPSAELRMLEQVRWMYRPLFEAGVTADFAAPDEDLSGYPVVLVPSLYLLTEAEGASLRRYVENGGTAVISFWSGIVDEHDRCPPGPLRRPTARADRRRRGGCGAPPARTSAVEVAWADGRRSASHCRLEPRGRLEQCRPEQCRLEHWQDLIEATDGEVLARYEGRALGGLPSRAQQAVRRRAGPSTSGRAWTR